MVAVQSAMNLNQHRQQLWLLQKQRRQQQDYRRQSTNQWQRLG
jgi:hypothetical protein